MRGRGRRRRPWRGRLRFFVIYTEIAALLLFAIFLGIIGGTFYSVSKLLPSSLDIASYKPTEATKIISSDGVTLAEIYEENREVVQIEDIPKDLQNATVAIEDERFFRHLGVDFRGIARALYQNLRTGRVVQGGSTITQQLARNIYLTREKRLSRKLQEIVLALQLERNYSKQQILEHYLNQVYYGSGAYGVQTASRVYFDKNVKDLTLAECALLAGLPQKPSAYSPHEDLKLAVKRRNVVLDRMAKLGYITPEQRKEAKTEKPKIAKREAAGLARHKAPWFVTYVIKQLSEEYGADLVYRGGLKVYTTLSYEMQQAAEEELREGIAAAKSRHVTQGALVCIDPHTGYIKAMVGGVNPDFTKDQFNRAVQARRQPGSAFKAFVYTAAIDNGYDSYYPVSNVPITYKGKPWPRNYSSGQRARTYTIRRAIAESVNVCAVRMTLSVGIDQVMLYARMLGIKSPLSRNLSLALGASEVTPLEICSAYGVFAANGVRAEPTAVVRITGSADSRNESVIDEHKPVTHQVLSQQTAEVMNELFRGVVTSRGGTGYNARAVPNAHGKTGTTSNDRSAWFIGYTPELVTAVWVGNDDNSPMKRVWGGNVCAPAWSAFMLKALEIHERESGKSKPEPEFDRAERERDRIRRTRPPRETPDLGRRTVTICAESGLVATSECPTTYQISYDAGTEPHATCPLHKPETPENRPQPAPPATAPTPPPGPSRPGVQPRTSERYVTVTMCVDSGQIANVYCPETIPRQFRADEAPTRVCRLHKPPRP